VPWSSSVIGPEGGVVTYSLPNTEETGLQVRVPAGAWTACWEVEINSISFWDTPDYPDGFEPYDRPLPTGFIEISVFRQDENLVQTFAPDSMYMELSFPLHSIPNNDGEIFSTFYYDSTAGSWRVELPDDQNESELIVRTSSWRRPWSWGRIDLEEVDYEEHLAPVLEEEIGTEIWNDIQYTLDSIYDAAMQDRMELTCIALTFAEATFESFRDQAAENVELYQAYIDCGDCNPITPEFYTGLKQYVLLNVEAMALDLFTDAIPGRLWYLKLFGKAYVLALQAMARSLPCDYECFWNEAPPGIYLNAAAYYVSVLIIEVIQRYESSGYINCPGGTPPSPPVPVSRVFGTTGGATACVVENLTVPSDFQSVRRPQ